MTFTSFTFVVFLAVVFPLYWSLRSLRAQNVLLVASSYLFYGWWDYRFCGLLLLSSVVDYVCGVWLSRTEAPRWRAVILWTSIAINVGILATFKYFDFFADSFSALMQAFGLRPSPVTLRLVLPIGISFYTFQSLNYTIDVYRRTLEPSRSLVDFLAFVSYFPHLVAGPVNRARDLLTQIAAPRRFDPDEAVDGCRQMLWGALKKTVIADNLAPIVDAAYADPGAVAGPSFALVAFCFAIQIYCDFSGYSDIALGCSKLFGIRLMRNFAYPYFAQSLTDFWRRWHISLSTWFRDYVYLPLGGRDGGRVRQATVLLLTFGLSGLWHGAGWHFVMWGLLNGAGVFAERVWGSPRRGERVAPLRMIAVVTFFSFGLIFFRSQSMPEAVTIISRIIADAVSPVAWVGAIELAVAHRAVLLASVGLFAIEWVRRAHPHPLEWNDALVMPIWIRRAAVPLRWSAYTLIVLAIFQYAPLTGREFIYFQF